MKNKKISPLTVAEVSKDWSAGTSFPIVAIGASAGGLKALTELLQHLPIDTGMAFVVVQHLSPDHESLMTTILSRATKMQVREIADGMPVLENNVYVMPENAGLSISEGILKIHPLDGDHGRKMPIDDFFHSLANDSRNKALGVILSGSASDGSHGLMAIKEKGGITFAQDFGSAEYDSMPRSAVSTGCVDFICPPKEIAEKLAAISRHPYSQASEKETNEPLASSNDPFPQILKLLQKGSSINFSNYKPATLKRRIVRRMVLNKLESLKDYVALLEKNREELQALLQDVLIHVTQFFRDAEMFEALKKEVFPQLIKNRPEGWPLRVWVAGCATGEEAYSLAMALSEFLGERSNDFPIQIFATDAKDYCIECARKGIYAQGLKFNISPERLRRFFVKVGESYQIIKSIRDACIFAKQNVLADPPYSKIDLISCRNLLIYLGPELQQRILPTFHYALKPEGFLVLGKSESVASYTNLFQLVDKKSKIYSKKSADSKNHFDFTPHPAGPETLPARKQKAAPAKGSDIFKEADAALAMKYEHAGVVVNENMDILQFRGDTAPFLNNSPGVPSSNLFKMAVDGLGAELHIALQKNNKEGRPVQKKGIKIKYQDKIREVSIEVIPLKSSSSQRFFLILFAMEPLKAGSASEKESAGKKIKSELSPEGLRIKELEEEIFATKTFMHSIIEEREAANRELQSINEESQSNNEEFQSVNEELQSTNEELETAKEELQATNEEITTVNDELHNRISQLTRLNDDLQNLLTSIHLPVVMVDRNLRIRRFTRTAEKKLRLIPTDVGRPLTDLKLNIKLPMDALIAEVMTTASVQEQEVENDEGKWYLVHIRPYKTSDNKIDGAIIIMTDIDEIKKNQQILEAQKVKLMNSNQELEQFAYVASHDLQEPLRMISMYLDLIRGRYKDVLDKDALEFLAFAKDGSDRSQKLIYDLLEYARIGTKGKSPKATDFESILKRVLSNLEIIVLDSGAEITHDPLPTLMTDSFQMVQLWQNLLSNAIKYKSDEPLKVHISAKRQGGEWLFSIKDNGIGIEPQYNERIFGIFQRLHAKTELPGTGIGLAVCRKIVERHGGKIWMESTLNEGSTFFFTLSEETLSAGTGPV